ncbi:hypothetical protein BX257_1823 [Streptomyces sp. 3212.3]|nr:hypothetical protein BX257_1823 [Streptomyces sp. 3212.3]
MGSDLWPGAGPIAYRASKWIGVRPSGRGGRTPGATVRTAARAPRLPVCVDALNSPFPVRV